MYYPHDTLRPHLNASELWLARHVHLAGLASIEMLRARAGGQARKFWLAQARELARDSRTALAAYLEIKGRES